MSTFLERTMKSYLEKKHNLKKQFFDSMMDQEKIDGTKFTFGSLCNMIGAKLEPQDSGEPITLPLYILHSIQVCAKLSFSSYEFEFKSNETAGKLIFQDEKESAYKLPIHVTYNENNRVIYIVLRGTLGFGDIITDLTARSVEFEDGLVHSGVLQASETAIKQISPIIEKQMQSVNDLRVVLTGHSLGAAAAGLCLYILKKKYENVKFSAVLFAPPPTMSLNMWERTKDDIISFALNDDPVPFLSLHNVNVAASVSLPKAIAKVFDNAASQNTLIPPGTVYRIEIDLKDSKKTKLVKTFAPKHYTRLAKGLNESHHAMPLYDQMITILILQQEDPSKIPEFKFPDHKKEQKKPEEEKKQENKD